MSILLALLAVIGGAAMAEASSANAWTQTTAQGLMDALGLQLGLPDGANNVSWQMLEQAQMGQVRFTWQGDSYTARVAPTDEFEDISGLNCDWERQADCAVGRCKAVCRTAHGDDGSPVSLCLWYDDLTGLMYSVSAGNADPEGADIQAAARMLYIPMQTE